MFPERILKTSVYYASALIQGVCLILIPAASFIFKSPSHNGISDEQYGFLFLPMISGAIGSTVFFKGIVKRVGEERIYYAGLLLNAFYFAALSAADLAAANRPAGFFLLMLANLFLGLGFGLLVSVLNLLSVELFPSKRDAVVTGLHACLGIGAALAPLFVNLLYGKGIWPGGLAASAAFIIAFCLLTFFMRAAQVDVSKRVREEMISESVPKQSIPAGAFLFLIAIFLYGIAESVIGNWTTLYLMDEKAFSMKTVSLALSTFWLFMTVGRLLATVLVLKIDARLLYRFSPLVIVVSLIAIVMTVRESRILFFYVLAGLGCSYFFPFSISLSTRYFDAWRDQLASLAIAALMLGVGVGTSFIGILRDQGVLSLQQAFLTAVACSVAIGVMSYVLTWKRLAEARA